MNLKEFNPREIIYVKSSSFMLNPKMEVIEIGEKTTKDCKPVSLNLYILESDHSIENLFDIVEGNYIFLLSEHSIQYGGFSNFEKIFMAVFRDFEDCNADDFSPKVSRIIKL